MTVEIVEIPFNDWSKKALVTLQKRATSRSKKYGNVGDIFVVDNVTYKLLLVVKLPLWFVTTYLFSTEGASDRLEFIRIWEKIHPRKGWIPDTEVWYHFFMVWEK